MEEQVVCWQPARMAIPRDKELLRSIGARVRSHRERRGLSQQALAEAARLQPETISRIETGSVSAALTTLWSLASALGVPFGDLVDGERPVPMADLSQADRAALEAWRQLSSNQRALVLSVMSEMAGHK